MDPYCAEFSEAVTLRQNLSHAGVTTWGWVIYRCTYQSDVQWQAFMDEINTRVRRSLEFYKDVDLMDSLDWAVQEDKAYEGASKDEIRRHFRSVRDQISGDERDVRSWYCLAVDQASLESVLRGASAEYYGLDDFGYVYIIDASWGEEEKIEDRDLNGENDDEPPIEGCTNEDVGVAMLDAYALGPRWFNLMWDGSWSDEYKRMPERMNLT